MTKALTRSIWWKIYFYIFTCVLLFGMVLFLDTESVGTVDYLAAMLFIVATVGFYGFVFLKKVLSPQFWFIFLIIYIVFGIAYETLTSVDLRKGISDEDYYTDMLLEYLLLLPSYYALFSYGKKSNPIWGKAEDLKANFLPKIKPLFVVAYIFGAVSFFGSLFLFEYILSGHGLFSEGNSYVFILACAILSGAVCSYYYNKNIAFPMRHPAIAFFKIFFSKSTLVPPIWYPLGVLSSQLAIWVMLSPRGMLSMLEIAEAGLALYFISTLGSFLGILISNSKLSA